MLCRQVLVLNQNFEPISVCSVRRAVIMLYMGKAETIETADGLALRSQSIQIPVPSVIRLDFYVKVPVKRIMLTRKNIIKRDGGLHLLAGSLQGIGLGHAQKFGIAHELATGINQQRRIVHAEQRIEQQETGRAHGSIEDRANPIGAA